METFFEAGDYEVYQGLLTEWCRKAGTEIWAWCLMPNHLHLIVVPSHEDGPRAALGEAHRRYTRQRLIPLLRNTGKTPGKLWEMVVSTVIVIPLRD
jgi:REP element-mobilizing transposase RayT